MERNQLPIKTVLAHTSKITPSMRFDGGDFAAWQKAAGEKLTELLGLPFEKCEELFTIDFEEQHEDFKEIRFAIQSEEGYFVPCHLLIPSGVTTPVPTVICLQGHSTGMHMSLGRTKYPDDREGIDDGDRDFAIGAVKRGYCAIAVEQRCMGECGQKEDGDPDCYGSSMANLLIGRTTVGERVWDVMRVIDAAIAHFADVVDKDNIICLGHSGGGTTTFYAACLEERIKTAFVSCAFASFDKSIAAMYHCSCNFIPNIRKYFDMGDLSGLIAPKNLILVSGAEDDIFPLESAKEQFEITQKLFDKTNGKCAHVVGDGGHRFYYDKAWSKYDELIKEG